MCLLSHLRSCFVFVFCIASSHSEMAKVLNVMLVRVEPNSVLLEWNCFPPTVRQQLVTCQARYGLLTPEKITQGEKNETDGELREWWRFKETQIDVLDHFLPDSSSFLLNNLMTNTSYVFAMICSLYGEERSNNKNNTTGFGSYATITSNPIFFTTRLIDIDTSSSVSDRKQANVGNPSRYHSHASEFDDRSIDPIRWSSKLQHGSNKPMSFNIIIGIVCGLIGFLIINVTVIMALRKYSRWRSRQIRVRQLRFIYGDSPDNYYDVT